tara:strand:+ start:856 stop:1977 length:1122 start_codon:yes stop_codon:yes gene_type:complete
MSKLENMSTYTKNLLSNASFAMTAVFVIIFIVVLLFVSYVYTLSKTRKIKCNTLDENYPEKPSISSLQNDDYGMKLLLRDFYIKSAYNCCSISNFKNSFVDLCALKNCIKQGVRCFDMEIYSLNDEPIISTSSIDDYHVKQTYNYIKFTDLLKTLDSMAFSSTSPSQHDPVFIHLRIKSKNKIIYDKMAKYISSYCDNNKLLGPKYSNEYNGKSLGNVPIKELMGKYVFMTERSNTLYIETKLFEYINLASKSIYLRGLRNYDVEYTNDHKELIEYNKKNMTLSMPDLSNSTNNVKAAIHLNYGCQFVCMCYQNLDQNMQYINKFFTDSNRSLVLKPEKLRYIPVTIDPPKKQDPNLSYATRDIKADYYKFNI